MTTSASLAVTSAATAKALVLAATLAALAAHGDVWPSFAGRLLLDSPAPLALEVRGALAPWRMMLASGMTEREDGTRDFAFTADGAPRIAGTFRVNESKQTDLLTPNGLRGEVSRVSGEQIRVSEKNTDLRLVDNDGQLELMDNPFTVFALGSDGKRECEVPFSFDPAAGALRFRVSTRQPFGGCLCYEIVRE